MQTSRNKADMGVLALAGIAQHGASRKEQVLKDTMGASVVAGWYPDIVMEIAANEIYHNLLDCPDPELQEIDLAFIFDMLRTQIRCAVFIGKDVSHIKMLSRLVRHIRTHKSPFVDCPNCHNMLADYFGFVRSDSIDFEVHSKFVRKESLTVFYPQGRYDRSEKGRTSATYASRSAAIRAALSDEITKPNVPSLLWTHRDEPVEKKEHNLSVVEESIEKKMDDQPCSVGHGVLVLLELFNIAIGIYIATRV
jgi:hypothetical protein